MSGTTAAAHTGATVTITSSRPPTVRRSTCHSATSGSPLNTSSNGGAITGTAPATGAATGRSSVATARSAPGDVPTTHGTVTRAATSGRGTSPDGGVGRATGVWGSTSTPRTPHAGHPSAEA